MPRGIKKSAALPIKNIGNLLKAFRFQGVKSSTKTDGATVKDFDSLIKMIRRHSGEKMPGSKTPEQAAKEVMFNKSGLITDMLPKMFGKKIGNAAEKHYDKFQQKLTDADIKAGHRIYSALKNGKGGFRDKLSRAFLYKHQIPVKESVRGEPEKLIGVNVPGATAPIEKARKTALPIIGSFAIGSKLADMANDKNRGEGGGKKMEKVQQRREGLIEKLSSMIGIDTSLLEDKQNIGQTQLPSLASAASKMLKFAASEHRRLLDDNEKLASENRRLQQEIEHKTKHENATRLAELMNEKGMIKKADINMQVEKIIDLDEAGYSMLKSAIENINAGSLDKDGFDKLTFLDSGINIDTRDKKPTLADAIGESM